MTNRKGKFHQFFLLIIVLVVIAGCRKEPQQLGFGIQPESDQIDVLKNDTASIRAYSKRIDSINTTTTNATLFGSQYDPVFGVKTASFSSQFRLSRTAFSFGAGRQLDSLVLYMRYSSLYGDTLESQNMKIYELTEKLSSDSLYYSNMEIEYSDVLLADIDFVPNTIDSVVVDGDTVPPLLRVNLTSITDELADKLLNATDEEMTSNAEFLDFFYGLRIEAEKVMTGGSIISFNLSNALSKMTLYYSNDEADSLSYDYSITESTVRVGHFSHDYSQGDVQFRQQVIEGDTTLGDERLYVQSMAGVVTDIFFPGIKSWFDDGPVTINDARLIIEGVEDPPEFTPPPNIIIVRINEDGTVSPLVEQLEGQAFFGGFYVEEDNQYWFRLTEYIQNLMREDVTDYGLQMFVDAGSFRPNRFIFHGPNPSEPSNEGMRMRLEVVYTKL